MSDGNSQTDGQPTNTVSAPTVMSSLEPGAFGVMECTSPIESGAPDGPAMNTLSGPEGSITVERHPLRIMPVAQPAQDTAGLRDDGAR